MVVTAMTTEYGPDYLILGLPRHRTAWLACWLCTIGHTCYHEGITAAHSLADYNERTAGVGDATTALSQVDVHRLWPAAKVIVIDGSVDKVMAWSEREGINVPRDAIETLDKALREMDAVHVSFEELDDQLDAIYEYLFGAEMTAMQVMETRRLQQLNVQLKDSRLHYRDRVLRVHSEMMGETK